MELKKTALAVSFMMALAGGGFAYTPVLTLPDGTPEQMDGYYSGSLFRAYQISVDKDDEEAALRALNLIRTGFLDPIGDVRLRKHGTSFRFYPATQPTKGERALGEIFYVCDRKKETCDWVMRAVTVPIVEPLRWAYENFDITTAVSSLKERNIEPGKLGLNSGFLLNLPSPAEYIRSNAKKQLYFGKECSAFTAVLGVDYYGRKRARHLLNESELDEDTPTPKHVSNAKFDISIIEDEPGLKIYHTRPVIELNFSGDAGDALGNKLFESIKDCPNRADAEL